MYSGGLNFQKPTLPTDPSGGICPWSSKAANWNSGVGGWLPAEEEHHQRALQHRPDGRILHGAVPTSRVYCRPTTGIQVPRQKNALHPCQRDWRLVLINKAEWWISRLQWSCDFVNDFCSQWKWTDLLSFLFFLLQVFVDIFNEEVLGTMKIKEVTLNPIPSWLIHSHEEVTI